MSDYDVKEDSVSDGAPYELYEFTGAYTSYYMTTDSVTHIKDGKYYIPTKGLKRNSLKVVTHSDDSANISITIPVTEQIVSDYGFQITPPSLILTIYRYHRDATSFVSYWKGPVSSIKIDNEYATFMIPGNLSSILQGNIPNVYIQPPCNNVLFDNLCKADRSANSITTRVIELSGRTITIESVGAFASGWFIGGEIVETLRNERRMIVGQSGAVLTVNYDFGRISAGDLVQVTAGCDHSYAGVNGCPKFNNQRNFGGFPFVPGESNNLFVRGVN
jgi:uncharacterized phage protein (TIGR02218 family)